MGVRRERPVLRVTRCRDFERWAPGAPGSKRLPSLPLPPRIHRAHHASKRFSVRSWEPAGAGKTRGSLLLVSGRPGAAKMFVVKRDGRKEPVHFDKITARITKLSYGLNPDFCDPVRRPDGRPRFQVPVHADGPSVGRLGGGRPCAHCAHIVYPSITRRFWWPKRSPPVCTRV